EIPVALLVVLRQAQSPCPSVWLARLLVRVPLVERACEYGTGICALGHGAANNRISLVRRYRGRQSMQIRYGEAGRSASCKFTTHPGASVITHLDCASGSARHHNEPSTRRVSRVTFVSMSRASHYLSWLTLALAIWTFPCFAQSDEDMVCARAAAKAAQKAFVDGNYDKSIELFEKAESLVHATTDLLFIARAHEKEGRPVQ